ncbi:hypothetical protein OEZ86_010746 [Tetradesmus obliquus]|nr:hypothetical protein OEZ86_010746 [Tetradesmus obliquus]
MRSLGKQCRANQVQHNVPSAARIGAAVGRSCFQTRNRLAGSGSRHHASTILRAVAEAVQGESKELALYSVDPQLADHREHLDYRWNHYKWVKGNIEQAVGSLDDFAKGFESLGFVRKDGKTIYREWAPGAKAAALIGDFNNWECAWMQKDEWGVWSVELPDGPDGSPAIPHNSRVKIRMQAHGDWWCDRVPAWIKYATVPEGEMGAKYNGVYWDPPRGEKHLWRNRRPKRPSSLKIYEAHVGMSGEDEAVSTYAQFRDEVLPRIKKQGYTAIQLMAIQEHAYYASFGYHVTNPFAISSRSGTPEDLKSLIDAAHGMGLVVLLDVVHSHISSNADDGLAGFDMGQGQEANYFRSGEAGYHKQWDSRILNYGHWEVQRYLLSNLRYWLDEFQFDGFRFGGVYSMMYHDHGIGIDPARAYQANNMFDGVTSMLYHHHGIDTAFSGHYHEYFGPQADVEACVYLMMANEVIHKLHPDAITIAEDVSGMPTLCRPVSEGGLGFDYRLNMAIPDTWIRLLKHVRDEDWEMMDLVNALCNRRYTEKTVAYAESHDQAMVGDKTIAMWLFDAEMYTNMSTLNESTPVTERGMALHKMIRMVTMALGGEAWLNFMGNEFGHPEWLDFPREGNEWSHKHCRRQWSLVDTDHMRYHQLNEWDRAMMELDEKTGFLSSSTQWVTAIDQERQVLVAERGPLVFVWNWHPSEDYEGLKVAAPEPGKYKVVMDSDAWNVGGQGRVHWDGEHFTQPAEDGKFNERDQYFQVFAPSRTVVAYMKETENMRQQQQQQQQSQSQDNAAASSGGRFSAYIQSRTPAAPAEGPYRNGSGSGNGNGNGSSSEGGRFAAYYKSREGGNSSSSNGAADKGAGYSSSGGDGGRFADIIKQRYSKR